MSETALRQQDIERGGHIDDQPNQPHSTPNQPPQPSREEINYGDCSWPLYAMYSKIAQEGDNKISELHQRSADGILIFTGLFSAIVATFLAVSIPDLKPNAQDTSAFYLENIYQLFANSNGSDGSTPSSLVKPPRFSPPRYVICVNSLWALALLISLTGALLATLEQRHALRFITITQNQEFFPERRARIHAMLAKSENGRFRFRDSDAMLFCLHLSLFLFMAGVLIYFFNISHTVFYALIWCIAIVTILYAAATLAAISPPDELFCTPFSSLTLRLYLIFLHAACQVCFWIKPLRSLSNDTRKQYQNLRKLYRKGLIEGKLQSAQEKALKSSSTIDTEVLERILLALDEDHALQGFFDAIPGFCDSKLVKKPLDSQVMAKLKQSLDGYLDRTFSSHLVTESDRSNRLITCLNAAHSALGPSAVSQILGDFFKGHRHKALNSVKMGHSLRRWNHSNDDSINSNVRRIVACIITRAQDRDEQWTKLVKEVFGVPDGVFREYLVHGDSVLLAILIHVTREVLRTGRPERGVLESLSQFAIHNTVSKLRHDFCTLWDETVREARNQGASSTATQILAGIRHPFATLHQATDSFPNWFPAPNSIDDLDTILRQPLPSCNTPSHRSSLAVHEPATTSPSISPPIQHSISHMALPYPASASQAPQTVLPAVTENVTSSNADTSFNSGAADLIRGSSSSGGPIQQEAEETRLIPTIPPSVAFGSLPTPIPTPALSHSVAPAIHPSSMDSAVTQIDHVPRAPGSPSPTSPTAPLSVLPQVITVPIKYLGGSSGTDSTKDNATLPSKGG